MNWIASGEEGRPGGGAHLVGIVARQLSTAGVDEVVEVGGESFVVGDLRFVVAQIIHEEEDEVWLLRGQLQREKEKEGNEEQGCFHLCF